MKIENLFNQLKGDGKGIPFLSALIRVLFARYVVASDGEHLEKRITPSQVKSGAIAMALATAGKDFLGHVFALWVLDKGAKTCLAFHRLSLGGGAMNVEISDFDGATLLALRSESQDYPLASESQAAETAETAADCADFAALMAAIEAQAAEAQAEAEKAIEAEAQAAEAKAAEAAEAETAIGAALKNAKKTKKTATAK